MGMIPEDKVDKIANEIVMRLKKLLTMKRDTRADNLIMKAYNMLGEALDHLEGRTE